MITFTTRLTTEQHSQRSQLLQESMREENLYPIELEYPLAFANPENSVTGIIDSKPVTHANILFRNLVNASGQNWKVALIGNVATQQSYRGQGLQRELFNHLEQKAVIEHADALILWSDLIPFYQKLGFREFGSEIRFQWSRRILGDRNPMVLSATTAQPLPGKALRDLLSLRPNSLPTITRTESDFQALLTIPETTLIRGFDGKGELSAWAISGKGCDMRGVAHEWGAKTIADLDLFFSSLCEALQGQSFMILAPRYLDQQFLKCLENGSLSSSYHSMAMLKQLSENTIPEDAFIWGLDSI